MTYSVDMGAYEQFCVRMGVVNVDTMRLAIDIDNGLIRPDMSLDEQLTINQYRACETIDEAEYDEFTLNAAKAAKLAR